MFDNELVIRYTGALYKCDEARSPRYDEFRDMFSSGQVYSKQWLADEISRLNHSPHANITICGGWFATLAFFIFKKFPQARITTLDLDPRCEFFVSHLIQPEENLKLKPVTADMYAYSYETGLIINTSCEHIPELEKWLRLLPRGSQIVLQSSNYRLSSQHVSCVNSVEELISKTGSELQSVLFSGELKFPMYSRYMVIGIKN